MLKTLTLLTVALSSTIAFAQAEPAKPAPPANPAEMAPPKPAPELTEMIKSMTGVWKCERTINAMGNEMKAKAKVTSTAEVGGWVASAKVDVPKSKQLPMGMTAIILLSYDPAAKVFTQTMYDSFGGVTTSTSKGWEGDSLSWTGKSNMERLENAEIKETVTRKGPRETHTVGSAGSGAQAVSWDMTCKK
jgi:hypothetical protein